MQTRSQSLRFLAVFAMVALTTSGCAWVQRANVDSAGHQGSNDTNARSLSANGRYVVFDAYGTLNPGQVTGLSDVFVRDVAAGTTTRVSIATDGTLGDATSYDGQIAAGGRYVAFTSFATNLVAGDTNNALDVFVRDTVAGTTTRLSVDTGGVQGNGDSSDARISADGRYVAFDSRATNLVAGDTNATIDVFVRDLVAGTTTRVSVGEAGAQGNAYSSSPAISADGVHIAFLSGATNLVAGPMNSGGDIFVRDIAAGTTTRASVAPDGTPANNSSGEPAVSADGRYVAFDTYASNLATGDTNSQRDVYLRDTVAGTTVRISVDSAGNQAVGDPSGDALGESLIPAISADGRYVAYSSDAINLVPGDTNHAGDAFVRDRAEGTTTRVSVDANGVQGNADSGVAAISADGRYVLFTTRASNLVPGDTNHAADAVVRANPQPTVTGIAPSTLTRGTPTRVTITGSGFLLGALVVVDGSGAVSAVTVVSPTQITATVTVDADAPITTRNVWVELPGTGAGVTAGALGVCAGCVSVTGPLLSGQSRDS